jgi:hypothetical protein
MDETLTVPSRFRGPATTAQGGYAAGSLALVVGNPATVLVRRPPPLDRALDVRRDGDRVGAYDGEELVLLAEPVTSVAAEVPALDWEAVPRSEDVVASLDAAHGAPTCVVCGPARDDGMRVFPGDVADGVVACRWVVPPHAGSPVPAPLVWAILDCPGGWAVVSPYGSQRDFFPALQRQAADVRAALHPGEEVVVAGWRPGEDGRKRHAATAIVDLDGGVRAVSAQTCVALPADWALVAGDPT